jgi:hypothetical protein
VTGLEAESWKDSAPIQGIGGFIGGVALGLAPGAGLGERVLSAGGVLAPGTRAANIGKAFGEMVGGVALMFFGGGGTAAGIGVSATGIGAAVGVPAVAVSAGLATAGAANAAAGFQGLLVALTTGGGPSVSPAGGSPSGAGVSTSELVPTHNLTKSPNKFNELKDDISKNGLKETIKYVEHGGKKYIVDGHHRVKAARALGIKEVPAEKVTLPYKGYRTVDDLFNWDR